MANLINYLLEILNENHVDRMTYHGKAVTNPKTIPRGRTFWNIHILTMNCNYICLNFTNNTPTIEILL